MSPNCTFTPTAGTLYGSAFTAHAGTAPSCTFTSHAGTVFYAEFTDNTTNTMAVSVLNRSEITGLTTGTALAAISLANLTTNAVVVISIPLTSPYSGVAQLTYRLRVTGGDSQSLPRLVTSTYSTAYLWELTACVFSGAICTLNATDNKFYPAVAQTVDGVPSFALADTGFTLP